MKNNKENLEVNFLNRRRFMLNSAMALGGLTVFSGNNNPIFGAVENELLEPNNYAAAAFPGWLKRLGKIALKVGMSVSGVDPNAVLGNLEKNVKTEVDAQLKILKDKLYERMAGVMQGNTGIQANSLAIPTFKQIQDQQIPPFLTPFFNTAPNTKQIFGSTLSTPTTYSLLDVVNYLANEKGMDEEERFISVYPTVPKINALNTYPFSDLYITSQGGSVQFELKESEDKNFNAGYYIVRRSIGGARGENILFTGSKPGREFPIPKNMVAALAKEE